MKTRYGIIFLIGLMEISLTGGCVQSNPAMSNSVENDFEAEIMQGNETTQEDETNRTKTSTGSQTGASRKESEEEAETIETGASKRDAGESFEGTRAQTVIPDSTVATVTTQEIMPETEEIYETKAENGAEPIESTETQAAEETEEESKEAVKKEETFAGEGNTMPPENEITSENETPKKTEISTETEKQVETEGQVETEKQVETERQAETEITEYVGATHTDSDTDNIDVGTTEEKMTEMCLEGEDTDWGQMAFDGLSEDEIRKSFLDGYVQMREAAGCREACPTESDLLNQMCREVAKTDSGIHELKHSDRNGLDMRDAQGREFSQYWDHESVLICQGLFGNNAEEIREAYLQDAFICGGEIGWLHNEDLYTDNIREIGVGVAKDIENKCFYIVMEGK